MLWAEVVPFAALAAASAPVLWRGRRHLPFPALSAAGLCFLNCACVLTLFYVENLV